MKLEGGLWGKCHVGWWVEWNFRKLTTWWVSPKIILLKWIKFIIWSFPQIPNTPLTSSHYLHQHLTKILLSNHFHFQLKNPIANLRDCHHIAVTTERNTAIKDNFVNRVMKKIPSCSRKSHFRHRIAIWIEFCDFVFKFAVWEVARMSLSIKTLPKCH